MSIINWTRPEDAILKTFKIFVKFKKAYKISLIGYSKTSLSNPNIIVQRIIRSNRYLLLRYYLSGIIVLAVLDKNRGKTTF